MAVRIKQKKPGVWRLDVRVKIAGKEYRKRETIKGSKTQAEDRFVELRNQLRGDVKKEPCSLTIRTVSDLIDFYYEHNQSDRKKVQCIFEKIRADIGHLPLKDLGMNVVQYFMILRKEISPRTNCQYSNGTCNRFLAYAKAIFNLAIKYELIEKNPLARVDKMKETARDRVLTDDERKDLFKVLQANSRLKHLVPAVQFAIQVPIRKSELVGLKKDSLDMINGLIRLRNGTTKNGQGTYVPIPPNMIEYFRSIPAASEYLFYRKEGDKYYSLGDFKNGWKAALKEAKIEDFHFHDLRHISATDLIDNGTPDRIVRSIANWRTDMLTRYYHMDSRKNARNVIFASEPQSGHQVDTFSVKVG